MGGAYLHVCLVDMIHRLSEIGLIAVLCRMYSRMCGECGGMDMGVGFFLRVCVCVCVADDEGGRHSWGDRPLGH